MYIFDEDKLALTFPEYQFPLPQNKEMPGGPETVDFWGLHIWHPKANHNVFCLWLSLKKETSTKLTLLMLDLF